MRSDDPFVQAVLEMRQAQQRYFRVRSAGNLGLSKRLEKRVDDMLRDKLEPQLDLPSGPEETAEIEPAEGDA